MVLQAEMKLRANSNLNPWEERRNPGNGKNAVQVKDVLCDFVFPYDL